MVGNSHKGHNSQSYELLIKIFLLSIFKEQGNILLLLRISDFNRNSKAHQQF